MGLFKQKFGRNILDVIDEPPNLLLEVKEIGQIRVDRIEKSRQNQKETR